MPLFSTMGATHITSRMSLLMGYWPMALVYGRILQVYGERFVLNLTWCVPVERACAHGSIGQLAHICLTHVPEQLL